jgi:DNA repair ATPase RecN
LIPGLIEFTPLYNKPYNVLIQNHIQSFPEIPDAPEILQSMSSKIKGLDYSQSKSQTQVANIFSVLASQIENAKITPDEDTSFSEISNNFSESSMISDTIANIYALQGAFDAAINVYQKLAAQNIQKKEYYESKISEIIKRKKSTENYFDI